MVLILAVAVDEDGALVGGRGGGGGAGALPKVREESISSLLFFCGEVLVKYRSFEVLLRSVFYYYYY